MTRARDLADIADKDITGTLTADGLTVDQGSGGQGISLQRSSYDTMDIELSESGFRIRNETDGRTDLFIDGSGNVGIGTSSPQRPLVVSDAGTEGFEFQPGSASGQNTLNHYNRSTSSFVNILTNADQHIFGRADGEKMRIDSSGNVLMGKTDAGSDVVGCTLRSTGQASFTMDGNGPLVLNRKSNDGEIVFLQKNNTTIGHLKVTGGDNFSIDCTSTNHSGLTFAEGNILPRKNGANNNGNIDLGAGSLRFANLYAVNSTIQTSDETEKQNITSLTSAEITAAKAISALFKTYKFRSKVAAEGDAARTHTGVIAQDVQTAMSDAGLDASKYAFWCSDTWWEADETYTDDDGAEQTHTKVYNTADEAPEGATQKTMLGVRYPELLAFVGAATEQRLDSIETRLAALESAS